MNKNDKPPGKISESHQWNYNHPGKIFESLQRNVNHPALSFKLQKAFF